MQLFRAIQKIDEAAGEWFTYSADPASGEKIEFCIRPLPAAEERRIENKYMGRERKIVWTQEGRVSTQSVEKSEQFHAERALLALIDSRGAQVRIEDEDSAELYGKAFDERVSVGQLVTLDGRWTRPVKEQAFRDAPQIAVWLSLKASELRVRVAQEEEGKEAP